MSDVLLYQTNDNGEINIEGGVVEMSGGLDSAVYLSLFGGMKHDDGAPNNPLTWWGNLSETEPAKQYRSETQYLLGTLPTTSYNLGRIEEAAGRDLQWLLDEKIANSVSISATIPALNRVTLTIVILAEGERSTFNYTENWEASV